MTMTGLSPRSAIDLQGLQRLKQTARSESGQAEALQEASRQFEALFLQMMLKSMRDATPTSGLLDSPQQDMYTEMLDQQWSQQLAGQGVGVSEQLIRQLQQQLPQDQQALLASARANKARRTVQVNNNSVDPLTGIPQITPRPLYGSITVAKTLTALETQRNKSEAMNVPSPFRNSSKINNTESKKSDVQGRPVHIQNFFNAFEAPARAASAMSGVPAELIMAQAALETGWGRQQIPTGNGGNSHNLFGIKANSTWKGTTTAVTTTEFIEGVAQERVESFRVYPSYHAAFADYARLISNNPRYAGVISASTPAQAARALQQGGYATDPNYANKLIAIMKNMGSVDEKQAPLYARGDQKTN